MFNHFDLLAPVYHHLIRPKDPGKMIRLLDLPIAGNLLDAGGGTGRASSGLSKYVDDLVLSDASEAMLRRADGKQKFWTTVAKTERLPYPDDCFDRVLAVDALHHFADQEKSISELIRVLKPGGRMVIEEPDVTRLRVKLLALAEKLTLMQSCFCTPERIVTLISSHGYHADVERDNSLNAWIIVNK